MRRRNFMRFFEAKAYGSDGMRNPFFPRRVNIPSSVWAGVSVAMLGSLVIGGLAVAVYGPYLRIGTVSVEGQTTLSAVQIEQVVREQLAGKRFGILPNKHRWFFDAERTKQVLIETFPLERVSITRSGAEVQLVITEDISTIALRSGEEWLLLNKDGVILRTMTPEEKAAALLRLGEVSAPTDVELTGGVGATLLLQPDMPIIREKVATTRAPGDSVIDAERLSGIVAFQKGLKSLQIVPKEFVSEDLQLPWFAVTSDQDYLILFDAERDVSEQLLVFDAVVDEHFATQEPGQYIDVRFGTRVFVR